MDPACSGYDFWTIVDVVVKQGNTYRRRVFSTRSGSRSPTAIRRGSSASSMPPPCCSSRRSQTSGLRSAGDRVRADFWISHYGQEPLRQARLAWKLYADKAVLAEGTAVGGDVELGSVRSLGQADLVIPELQKPVHAVLRVSLAGGLASNHWDFWLFPKRAPQRVTGIAVSKPLLPKLAALYSGLVATGDPGAGQAPRAGLVPGFSRCRTGPGIRQTCPLDQRGVGKAQRQPGLVVDGRTGGDGIRPAPCLGRFPARRIFVSAGLSHSENGPETALPGGPPSGRHVGRRRRFGQLFSLRRAGQGQAGTGPADLWAGSAFGPPGRNLPAGWADALCPVRHLQPAGGSCLARHEREPEWLAENAESRRRRPRPPAGQRLAARRGAGDEKKRTDAFRTAPSGHRTGNA